MNVADNRVSMLKPPPHHPFLGSLLSSSQMTSELNTTLVDLALEGRIGTFSMTIKHLNGSAYTLEKPILREPSSINFESSIISEACNEGQVQFDSCDQFLHLWRQQGIKSEMGAVRVGLEYVKDEANAGTIDTLKQWSQKSEDAILRLLDNMRADKEVLRVAFNNETVSKRQEVDALKRRIAELEVAAGIREDNVEATLVAVKRFKPGQLSYPDYLEYAKRSEPFVVNYRDWEGGGMAGGKPPGIPGIPDWTLDNIRRTCFNRTFPLKAQDDR